MQLLVLNSQKHTLQAIHLLIEKAVISNFFLFLGSVHVSHQNRRPQSKVCRLSWLELWTFHNCLSGTCERWPMGAFSMTPLHMCHMRYGINPVDTP